MKQSFPVAAKELEEIKRRRLRDVRRLKRGVIGAQARRTSRQETVLQAVPIESRRTVIRTDPKHYVTPSPIR